MRGITVIAAAWALTACATPQPFRPTEAPGGEGAFERAQRALIRQGNSIDQADEKVGMITTEWSEAGDEGHEHQYRWVVTVDATSILIDSQCRFRLKDPGPLLLDNPAEDCGAQPPRRQQEADALAAAMAP